MIAQDLYPLLRAQPFVPFRIHGSDGEAREVRHPDEALITRTYVFLPIRGAGEVPERSEWLALAHIVRIEFPITPSEAVA